MRGEEVRVADMVPDERGGERGGHVDLTLLDSELSVLAGTTRVAFHHANLAASRVQVVPGEGGRHIVVLGGGALVSG